MATKKVTKWRTRLRVNPVARAVAADKLRKSLEDSSLRAHFTDDGQEARKLLSDYAFILGLGLETSFSLNDDLDRTKRIHSGLRTVLGMSVDGGKWIASQTVRLHLLAMEATTLAINHMELSMPAYELACSLSARVGLGIAKLSDVAGAEIYQQEKK